jgi:acetyl-CoA carboxylase biotin carboxyl carrier protein
MTFKEIKELIKLVSESSLSEFKITTEKADISIRTEAYSKGKMMVAPQAMMSMPQVSAPAPSSPSPAAAAPAVAAKAEEPEASANLLEIKSPIVGTFYRSASPDKPPYKKVGDKVSVGEVVCIVEAMKLFNEIESEVSGTIVQVMIEDASPIEYDQVLFLIDPS